MQEVFKLWNPDERILIMEKIRNKIVDLSWHKKGTHSVQTLVVELNTKAEVEKFIELLTECPDELEEEFELEQV